MGKRGCHYYTDKPKKAEHISFSLKVDGKRFEL